MTILRDFSKEAVDAAVEVNFLAFVENIPRLQGVALYRGEDMIRIAMPSVPHPLFNMVSQARLKDNLDEAIRSAMATFTARNLPFIWQIEPSTQAQDLGERLEVNGMQSLGQFPILVADLDAISPLSAIT